MANMSDATIPGCALGVSVQTLSAWRDQALLAQEQERLRVHITGCDGCRRRLTQYDVIAHALKTLAVPEPVGAYGHNPRRETMRGGGSGRRWPAPPTGLGALVAALVLVALASSLFSLLRNARGPEAPRIDTFALPGALDARDSLGGITKGPDSALYFTAAGPQGNAIGRISPSGQITRFPLSADAFSTKDDYVLLNPIIAGPDGNLWFAENHANKIGRLSPDGRHLAEFALPTAHSEVSGMTVGPDGNLWFCVNAATSGNGRIGRISPDGQTIVEYALPPGGAPTSIALGADGNLWFMNASLTSQPDAVGRITPDGQRVDTFPIPDGEAGRIVAGPDGALWFTEKATLTNTGKIGRVSTDGKVTQFWLPSESGAAADIVSGPDRALWFSVGPPDCQVAPAPQGDCPQAHALGRITPDGSMKVIPLPGQSTPLGIALGPDSNLWMTATGPAVIFRAPPHLP
jgi:virginiamycin B lyase